MAHAGFIVEFNNPVKYGEDLKDHMTELGLKARRLVHKTAWSINYNGSFRKFKKLKLAIARSISKTRGSALILSRKTGDAYVLRWRNAKKFYVVNVV
jgi:hypothetical protein